MYLNVYFEILSGYSHVTGKGNWSEDSEKDHKVIPQNWLFYYDVIQSGSDNIVEVEVLSVKTAITPYLIASL